MKMITYQDLADEIVHRWNVDTGRISRAIAIAREDGMVLIAEFDEFGNPLPERGKLWIVRKSRKPGYYYVDTHARTCTCYDSRHGHVCKHRIAVFLYRALRAIYSVHRTPAGCIDAILNPPPDREPMLF